MKLLAGDIGGTKTILQVVEKHNDGYKTLAEKRYQSQQYDTFERVLIQFYSEFNFRQKDISTACVGVAGPVTQTAHCTSSRVTNLPWKLDSSTLEEQFTSGSFKLINDFQAIGYGIEMLGQSDMRVLQQGQPASHGTRAVIGAGTGLGQAFMIWDDAADGYRVCPSEAGHTGFAPVSAREIKLLEFLSGKSESVSLEQVVSGPGITNIYHFLSQQQSRVPGEILLSANDSMDMTPTIVRHALAGDDNLAEEALDIFIHAYGAAAGNLALTVSATGGVYIAGGIAPKIIEKLTDGKFIDAFNAKSKMKSFLQTMPVYLITNEQTGLLGAVNYGFRSASPGSA